MKKKFFILSLVLFIFYSFNLLAESFPQKASKVEDFIPKGWKSVIVKKGDLIAEIHYNDDKNIDQSRAMIIDAYVVGSKEQKDIKNILEIIE